MSIIQTGSFTLSGGGASALGDNDTSSFQSVSFSPAFPEDSQVVVIPMVQTFNGSDSLGTRVADVTTKGFKIRMNELVVSKNGTKSALSDGSHKRETCGWIAFTV